MASNSSDKSHLRCDRWLKLHQVESKVQPVNWQAAQGRGRTANQIANQISALSARSAKIFKGVLPLCHARQSRRGFWSETRWDLANWLSQNRKCTRLFRFSWSQGRWRRRDSRLGQQRSIWRSITLTSSSKTSRTRRQRKPSANKSKIAQI